MTSRLLVVSAVVLASGAARADWPQLSASVGYTAQYFTARTQDLVDVDDQTSGFRVAAGATLAVGWGAVDFEAAWQTATTGATAHAAVPTQLAMRGVELGATWRYPLHRNLHPYAHLGAGWDWATLTLFNEQRLTQLVSHPSGTGLLGLQVPFVIGNSPRHPPTLLIDLGVGYVLRPVYTFDQLGPGPVANPGPEPIGNAAVSLGTMPLSGITWRLLVSFRM